MKKFLIWVIKNFWFPILLLILGLLAKKYPWAGEVHTKLKKFR